MNVTLYDDEIAEVHKAAYDIYKSNRSNRNKESFNQKLKNQIIGELCEKAVRIATKGTRSVEDGYFYDILCPTTELPKLGVKSEMSRVEVKHFSAKDKRWITFPEKRIFHATRGAKKGKNDVLFVVTIDGDIVHSGCTISAIVNPVGVFNSRVLVNPKYISRSQYDDEYLYLKKYQIKKDGMGIFYKL